MSDAPSARSKRVFKTRTRSASSLGRRFDKLYPALVLLLFLTLALTHAVGAALALGLTLVYAIRRGKALLRRPIGVALVLLLPMLALVSVLWSVEPLVTLRNSLQLIATALVGVLLARTQERRALLTSVFDALSLTILLCVLGEAVAHGRHPGAFQGIYDSKNELATVAMFALFASTTIAFSSSCGPRRRLIAWGVIAVSLALFIGARSAGAAVGLAAGLLIIAVALAIRRFSASWRLALVLVSVITPVAGASVLAPEFGMLRTEVPIMLGKNPNITGRTYLWNAAKSTIADKPALGHGYRAFWKSDLLGAMAIKQAVGLPSDANFNFHNEYFETGVDLGYVGIALLACTLAWSLLSHIWKLVRTQSVVQGFFTASIVAFALRSSVETSLLNQFTFFSTLFFCLATMAVEFKKRRSRRRGSSRSRLRRRRRRSAAVKRERGTRSKSHGTQGKAARSARRKTRSAKPEEGSNRRRRRRQSASAPAGQAAPEVAAESGEAAATSLPPELPNLFFGPQAG